MSTSAIVTTQIAYSGDIDAVISEIAATNTNSPAVNSLITLSSGANTITLPTGGSTVNGATIIPPAGNTTGTIILKGVTGDTGVQIHKTNPTTITFDSASIPSSIVLTASTTITGVRIIYF